MSNTVNYKGTDYLQIGGRWVNAQTYVAPPKIIIRELDLFISNENDNPKEIKSIRSQNKSPNRRERIQDVIGPKIVLFVKQRFEETQDWVTRDEIREALLIDAKTSAYLERKYKQTKQIKTFFEYVGNQIDHLSAGITKETSEFKSQLIGTEINNCWAYKPIL